MIKFPDQELVDTLKDAFSKSRYNSLANQLPIDKLIMYLSGVCYQASIKTEESHFFSFRVLVSTEILINEYIQKNPHSNLLKFQKSIALNVKKLIKIVPSAHPSNSIILTKISDDDNSTLEIWGILHTWDDYIDSIQGRQEFSIAPPQALTITMINPGNMIFTFAEITLLLLRDGEIVKKIYNPFYSPMFEDKVKKSFEDLTDTCKGFCTFLNPNIIEKLSQKYIMKFIKLLLVSIYEKRHGSIVIITNDVEICMTHIQPNVSAACNGPWELFKQH